MGGTASVVGAGLKHQRYQDVGRTGSGFGSTARGVYGNMFVNGMKLAGVDERITDSAEGVSNLKDGIQGYKQIKDTKNVRKSSRAGRDITKSSKSKKLPKLSKPVGMEKALSKFNVATAALGTAYSGYETYNNLQTASKVMDSNASGAEKTAAAADVGASAGNTLMSAGVVTSAAPIPGARVAGGVMVAGGAVLWGASKATKYVAKNWNSIKDTGKKAWEGTKNIAKKGWDAVTGIFS
ncbi:hypothetical protein [Lentibacillus kapialis]|nr:hypothetical protein [Lentibacillus kapialis]